MEKHHIESKSKSKSYVQTVGLLFILLVLPLGSWYYLSSGLNYQKSARAELKEYGSLPAFSFLDQEGKLIGTDTLKGKLILASFLQPNAPQTQAKLKTLKALHEQFDDRKKIWFVQFLLSESTDFKIKEFIEENDFEDRKQIFYLMDSTNQKMEELLVKGFKMPEDGLVKNEAGEIQLKSTFPQPISDYPYFILMDKEGTIRSYYDSREPGDMKRLVEHMSFIMPREK